MQNLKDTRESIKIAIVTIRFGFWSGKESKYLRFRVPNLNTRNGDFYYIREDLEAFRDTRSPIMMKNFRYDLTETKNTFLGMQEITTTRGFDAHVIDRRKSIWLDPKVFGLFDSKDALTIALALEILKHNLNK